MNTDENRAALVVVLLASAVLFVLVGAYGLFTKSGDRPLQRELLDGDTSPVYFSTTHSREAPWAHRGMKFSIVEKPGPDPSCGERLATGAELPLKSVVLREGEPSSRYRVLPDMPSMIAIGIMEAGVDAGVSNPISQYFGELGSLCDGQQINPESDFYWSVVQVSDHELGTVVKTEAGELPAYYSAYAVPGYIILVYGSNISLEQVRAVSAAQSKAVEASIWLTPDGQTSPWTFGIVDWLRRFLDEELSETATA